MGKQIWCTLVETPHVLWSGCSGKAEIGDKSVRNPIVLDWTLEGPSEKRFREIGWTPFLQFHLDHSMRFLFLLRWSLKFSHFPSAWTQWGWELLWEYLERKLIQGVSLVDYSFLERDKAQSVEDESSRILKRAELNERNNQWLNQKRITFSPIAISMLSLNCPLLKQVLPITRKSCEYDVPVLCL